MHNPHYSEFQEQRGESATEPHTWLDKNVFIQHNKKEELLADFAATQSSDIIFESGKVIICRRDTGCYKVQIKDDDNREVEASMSVYTDGIFPSTWSRVKCTDGEIINQFDYWMDRCRHEIREYARAVPEHAEISDNQDVLNKIRWMENVIHDNEYVTRVFKKRNDLVDKQFHWMLLKNFIQTMLNVNGFMKQAMIEIVRMVSDCKSNDGKKVPEDEIRAKINGVYTIVKDIMSRYKDVLAAKTLYTSMKKQLIVHRKSIKGCTECFVCCKDDQKATSLRCPWCMESSCEPCITQWWSTDACKMEVTLPCCKKPAWPMLFCFRKTSNIHAKLKKKIEAAILEKEKAMRYRYVQYVENKKHAESLEQKIRDGNQKLRQLRELLGSGDLCLQRSIEEGIKRVMETKPASEIGALHTYFGRLISFQHLDLLPFNLVTPRAKCLMKYNSSSQWDEFVRLLRGTSNVPMMDIVHLSMLVRLEQAKTIGILSSRLSIYEKVLASGLSRTGCTGDTFTFTRIRNDKEFKNLMIQEILADDEEPPHKKRCLNV